MNKSIFLLFLLSYHELFAEISMNLPILKILIIEKNTVILKQIVENILRCVSSFDRKDIVVETACASSLKSALEIIEDDDDIQAVVLQLEPRRYIE